MQHYFGKQIYIHRPFGYRFNEIIIKLHIAHDKISFRNLFHKIVYIIFKFFTTQHILYVIVIWMADRECTLVKESNYIHVFLHRRR